MEFLLSVGIQGSLMAVYLRTSHCDCVNPCQLPVQSVYMHEFGKFYAHFLRLLWFPRVSVNNRYLVCVFVGQTCIYNWNHEYIV